MEEGKDQWKGGTEGKEEKNVGSRYEGSGNSALIVKG